MTNELSPVDELKSQVWYLQNELDHLDMLLRDLATKTVFLENERDCYRAGFTHCLAALAGISNWMRRRGMDRSAEFIDKTARDIEAEVEGGEEEA